METPLSQEYEIRVYERTADGKLSLHQLANYLQDCAGRHATQLGWSVEKLQQGGQSWVLSRMKIQADRSISPDDIHLTVRTWPCGADRMYAYRAFDWQDRRGNTLGKAITNWVLLDLHKRRPVPMPQEVASLAEGFPGPAIAPPEKRLATPPVTDDAPGFRVYPSDLDVNRHVNHSVYLRWIEDFHRLQQPGSTLFRSIDILFKSEVGIGQQVTLGTTHQEDALQVSLYRQDGEPACIAELF